MKLLFQNYEGKERAIADVNSFTEANEEMDKFMSERNFKSYYKRMWNKDNNLFIDVGSWSEFFIIEDYSLEDVNKELEALNKEDL